MAENETAPQPPAGKQASQVRYLGSLAAAAILILVIGIAIRPQDRSEAPPPTETSLLQQLSQEAALHRESAYLDQRIRAVSDQVVHVPGVGAAVRWTRDTLVSSARNQPVVAVLAGSANDTIALAPSGAPSAQPQRLLLVARQPNGTVVSLVGMYGGRASVACNGANYEALVLNTALSSAFAGGGVFNLDGARVGLIVECGSGLVALPVREVERLLREASTASSQLRERYGIGVTPIDAATHAALNADSGLVITQLDANGAAAQWGLVVTDVLVSVNERPVHQPGQLLAALNAFSPGELRLLMRRNGVATTIAVTPLPAPSAALTPAPTPLFSGTPRGVLINELPVEHRLYRVGLRPGDEITRIDNQNNPGPATLRRVLADTTGAPIVIRYRRGAVQLATFLPRRP